MGDRMWHNAYPKAAAQICGGREHPLIRGMVRFLSCERTVLEVEIMGLPRTENGFFGFHIHEGGCCVGEAFTDTGGYYDPAGAAHPRHARDLPPLLSNRGEGIYDSIYRSVLRGGCHWENGGHSQQPGRLSLTALGQCRK